MGDDSGGMLLLNSSEETSHPDVTEEFEVGSRQTAAKT